MPQNSDLLMPDFPPNPDDHALYCLAIASQFLADTASFNTKAPSENNTITLYCKNNIELQYIWTALMVIGKQNSDTTMRFNNKALRVGSPANATPENELGWVSTFSKNSLYETKFKQYITDNILVITNSFDKFEGILLKIRRESFQLECDKHDAHKKQLISKQLNNNPLSMEFFPRDAASRVKYSMAFASKILAINGEAPTEKKPLWLSDNQLTTKYLWTALMVLGHRNINNFTDKAIFVEHFGCINYIVERGIFTAFAKNSFYETEFKQYLTDDMLDITDSPQAFDGILESTKVPFSLQLQEEEAEKQQKKIDQQIKKDWLASVSSAVFLEDTTKRVKFSMAYVSMLLAVTKMIPSEIKPMYIRGSNSLEAGYIWTALMIFGQRHPDPKIRFGHKTIKIDYSDFNPLKELGSFYTFASNSLYETEFKQYLTDEMIVITDSPQAFDGILEEARIENQAKTKKLEDQDQMNNFPIVMDSFPKGTDERIRYSMAFASEMLKTMGKPPTEKEPFLSSGFHSAYQYLWTALMVLGERNPDTTMRFNYKALNFLALRHYTPTQLGWISTFSKNSLYETEFKKYLTNNMLVITDSPEAFGGILRQTRQREEAKKQEELKKQEEIKKQQEAKTQEERREQEERRKQQEAKTQEERRKKEELSKQEELQNTKTQEVTRKQEKNLLLLQATNKLGNVELPLKDPNTPQAKDIEEFYQKVFNIMHSSLIAMQNIRSLEKEIHQEAIKSPKQRDILSKLVCLLKDNERFIDITNFIRVINQENFYVDFQDSDGYTLTMRAIAYRREDVAEYLLRHKGANPLLKNKDGLTAADMLQKGTSLYELAIELQDTFNLETDVNLQLQNLVKKQSTNILEIRALLQLGAQINYRDLKNGNTPLMIALEAQNDHVVQFLILSGADTLIMNSAMRIASDFISRDSTIYPLLKQKEKEVKRILNPNKDEFSIELQVLASSFQTKISDISKCIKSGAEIDYQNSDGFTALMIATDAQNNGVAEYLLKCGANPFLENNDQETAKDLVARDSSMFQQIKGYELIFATVNENINHINALLNADNTIINFQGKNGNTPLMIAVEQNMKEVVKCLLERGANPYIADDRGNNALDRIKDAEMNALFLKEEEEEESNATEEISETHRFFKTNSTNAPKASAANEQDELKQLGR